MTQKVYIPIGLPNAGKTTYFFKHPFKLGVLRISRDAINEMLSGDIYTDNINKVCRASELSILQEALEANYSIYIDRMNLTPKSRKRFINKAKALKSKLCIIALYFQTSEAICLDRNHIRTDKTFKQKQELRKFISQTNQQLIPPTLVENFYEIHYIDKEGNLERIESAKKNEN